VNANQFHPIVSASSPLLCSLVWVLGTTYFTASSEEDLYRIIRPEQIKQTSIDLSPAFISGIIKPFPAARPTLDRFHGVKLLNEAMDDVRKQKHKEHEQLKGHRYTFLKNKLSDKKQSRLNELIYSAVLK